MMWHLSQFVEHMTLLMIGFCIGRYGRDHDPEK